MGYASYLEDITEKTHENRMMRGAYEDRLRPKSFFVPISPPLQPALSAIVIPPPARPDAETMANRAHAACEKHVLALYELMPGHRWRH
jgi:hypothetical protein